MSLLTEDKTEFKSENKRFGVYEYPDDMLQTTALPYLGKVTEPSFQGLLDGLENTMKAYGALGISGPQVGILYRVISIHTTSGPLTMVNPVIKTAGGHDEVASEGCLSFPGLTLKVRRKTIIEVSYTDRDGETKDSWFRGAEARAIQHEVDHLDGVVFIDRIPKVMRSVAMKKFRMAPRAAKKSEKQMKVLLRRMAVQAKKEAEPKAFAGSEVKEIPNGGVLTQETIEAASAKLLASAGTGTLTSPTYPVT